MPGVPPIWFWSLCVWLSWGLLWADEPLQYVVVTTSDVDSHQGAIRLLQRTNPLAPWVAESAFAPALLGRNGLAWGRGLHPTQPGLQKREHDGRSPAGVFKIGLVLGTAPTLPSGAKWNQYHVITARDAWPDDPTLPEYNHLFTLQPGQTVPDWFNQNRMKPSDPTYHWLVFIEHNYPEAIPGMGSAIFLHARRGEDIPSSGCTAMARDVLEKLIVWLDPAAQPRFVLLTAPDYRRFWQSWQLPPPELALPESN